MTGEGIPLSETRSRIRIAPPQQPGWWCDCIEGVRPIYILGGNRSIIDCPRYSLGLKGARFDHRLLPHGTRFGKRRPRRNDISHPVRGRTGLRPERNEAVHHERGDRRSVHRAESIVYRVAGLLDRRLEAIEKKTPNYYGAYQKGIEEYATGEIDLLPGVMKAATSSTGSRAEAIAAAVKACAYQRTAAVSLAAARAAAYIEEGKRLEGLVERIETFCRYDATGLLAAKRTLAATALEAERYIF